MGTVLSQCSISASRPEVTGGLTLSAGLSTVFISINRHTILFASPAQSLSVIFDFCFRLFADSWSNQLPNPDNCTSAKFFQSLFCFPFPCHHSRFNDLSFRMQKLPPNLFHCLQPLLFYLVPCYQTKILSIICVIDLFLCSNISNGLHNLSN